MESTGARRNIRLDGDGDVVAVVHGRVKADEVGVAVETPSGPVVENLLAHDSVHSIKNPKQLDRFRDRPIRRRPSDCGRRSSTILHRCSRRGTSRYAILASIARFAQRTLNVKQGAL